jgi:hypothetical protein
MGFFPGTGHLELPIWSVTGNLIDRTRYSLSSLRVETCRSTKMKTIKTYPSRIEADLARIALDASDVLSVVVGIGVGMEGGMEGVQLLVPEDQVEAALKILKED